jgi:circadian clock protein KaiC
MTKKPELRRVETGVRNLDAILHGGLPKGSVSVLSGPPGSGKTILAQQICFHNASPTEPALLFNTLSEPTAKTLRYLSQFSYFDPQKLDESIRFVDLGMILREKGLERALALIMENLREVKPAIVVIDSFKVFDDLAKSHEELRKFGYEVAVNLMAWETTALLLGEYAPQDFQTNPLFSIVDGLFAISQRELSGEQQRFLQITKMRGTDHSRDEHSFVISSAGIAVFAPRVTIKREPRIGKGGPTSRRMTGISRLDDLIGEGIPSGSSLLVGGVAGTGKTVLSLEFLYRGALAGEKGIMFSFEETEERLRATARGFGWELDREIERGMVEIVFIPQPDVMIEGHLVMMAERIETIGAKRVVVDSLSVFLHKVQDPTINREKVFQLATVVHNAGAVGFFATDIPYGANRISRFGVEETVVDGVILLTASEEGLERQRYIEIYKLRNTSHLKGRHNLTIGPGGLLVFPRYTTEAESGELPPAVEIEKRLSTGVPGLDALLGGGLLQRSVTLLSGSAGIGKSTLGVQFVLEGAKRRELALYASLEEGPAQLIHSTAALGLPLGKAVDEGLVEALYLSGSQFRAPQLLTILEDKIKQRKASRLVLDGVTHLLTQGFPLDELRQLLYRLVLRLKKLGVTSVLTLESKSIFMTGSITDLDLSAVADNILVLRYAQRGGQLDPTVSVVKTRGSEHDRGTFGFTISDGGIRVGERLGDGAPPKAKQGKRAGKRSRTK